MAGSCVGPGLHGGPKGIELYGPRLVPWPSVGPGCGIDAANGLRVDPVSEKLWAPPDPMIQAVCTSGTQKVVQPTKVGTSTLTKLSIAFTAFACRKTFWHAELTGGTALFRLITGNFWSVQMASTIKINGAIPIYGFGQPYINTCENNAGGVISVGAATPNVSEHYHLDPGDKITLDVVFTLRVFTFAANPVNGLTWTPPGLTSTAWSTPL